MCGRFSQAIPLGQLAKRYGFPVEAVRDLKPRYNLAPTQQAVVIVPGENGAPKPVMMAWGFSPPWSKEGAFKDLINLRAETLLQRGGFTKILQQARCLVPADGFYEWRKDKAGKIPLRYVPRGDDFFALGGVFSVVDQPGGPPRQTFAIVTTEANDLVKTVHDRMPVIVPEPLEANWLNPLTRAFDYVSCLAPYPATEMKAYEVSPRVNSATNDSPDLIVPVH